METRHVLFAVMLTTAVTLPGAAAGQGTVEPLVAVLDFAVARNGSMVLPHGVGEAAADLLVDQLVASGRYRVLDRSWLTGRIQGDDPAAIAGIREAALAQGVEYLVLGSITRYSTERKNRTLGGAAFRLPFIGAIGRQRVVSALALTVRVVSVRSGEVVATASPHGDASRTSRSLGGLGAFGGAMSAGTTSGTNDALVSDALQGAITSAARALVSAAPRLTRPSAEPVVFRSECDR